MKRLPFLVLGLMLMSSVAAQAADDFDAILALFNPPLGKNIPNEANKGTKAKVDLGRQLYYDKRLSKNHDIACNSCHMLDKFGVDGDATSVGHKGQRGGRSAPTVYHAAGHIAQFWDGRAKDVEEQAKGPILNPIEMAMPNEEAVLKVVNSMPEYVAAFKKAFPKDKDAVTYDNLGKAIGAFERGLVTPSKFDKFAAGDRNALKDAEKQGFKDFVTIGCATCHKGTYFGGDSYQKLGLVKAWPKAKSKDQGRFEVTKKEEDRMKFKVPSLRNIAKTGPYFHDGSAKKLPEAIRLMGRHQLGRELTADQVKSIATFLRSLTGRINKKYTAEPELPASTDATPKPDPS